MAKTSAELLDLIGVAAELRAAGKSWEAVAGEGGRGPGGVRGGGGAHPGEGGRAYRGAGGGGGVGAAAGWVLVLRNLVGAEDDKVRRDAARQLLDFRLELAKLEGKANGS